MIKFALPTFLALVLIPLVSQAEESSFRFPGGDVEAGRAAFTSLNCIQCHTVAGVVLDEPKGKRRLELRLASEPRFVKSYEDLILSIVNPKHVVTEQYREILTAPELQGGIEPLMPKMISDMSAKQLIDIIKFLDAAYRESLESYEKAES